MSGVWTNISTDGKLDVMDVGLGVDISVTGNESALVLERGFGSGGGGDSVAIDDAE